MYFPFGKLTLKNSTVKRACWGAILGWVTSWKVSQAACERGRSTQKRFVVICGASHRSLTLFIGKTFDREGSGRHIGGIMFQNLSQKCLDDILIVILCVMIVVASRFDEY